MMKKILITSVLIFNLMIQWGNGKWEIQIGQSLLAQSPEQITAYLNSLNDGNIYQFNGNNIGMIRYTNGYGSLHTIYASSVSIPNNWTGSPTGAGFTAWLGCLSNAVSTSITNFLSSCGGGSGESEGEEWPNNGWEPMPDGFGYDPTDPNSVNGLLSDPNFNPGIFSDPLDQAILDNLDMFYDFYTGNYTVDCDSMINGTAYMDSCGICVGGTTGRQPCVKDCDSVWGGKSYKDSCGICIDSIRKQPCDSSYKKVGDSLYSYLYKPEFTDSLNKFIKGIDTASKERSMSLGTDSANGNFKASGINYSPDSTSAYPVYRFPGVRVFKLLHTHPFFGYRCFSGVDFYGLSSFYNHPLYNRIKSQYVIASDTSVYAMAIEDSLLYSIFINDNPYDSVKDANHGFDPLKIIGSTYLNVYDQLAASSGLGGTMSDNDAFDQAQAYILSKFNTGLVMYRKRKNETKFTKINTAVTKDPAGNDVYSTFNCL